MHEGTTQALIGVALHTNMHLLRPLVPLLLCTAGTGQSTEGGGWQSHSGDASAPPAPPGGIVGDLRPHIITHVGAATRTATLMKDSLLESTPYKDRPFVKTFIETQMFQVYSDHVMAALFEGRPT